MGDDRVAILWRCRSSPYRADVVAVGGDSISMVAKICVRAIIQTVSSARADNKRFVWLLWFGLVLTTVFACFPANSCLSLDFSSPL